MLILLAIITQSVIGALDNPPVIDDKKINCEMIEKRKFQPTLRVMSFNMLFDLYDKQLTPENRWPERKKRIIEYILHAKPDIIGSQELQNNQRLDLLEALGDEYILFGNERAILYRKDRLKLLNHRESGRFMTACFEDCKKRCFTVINTHFSFSSIECRLAEAKQLASMARSIQGPLIVTGDFNTFPLRPELPLPFFDGDYILSVIESGGLKDSHDITACGRFGPIASTNLCSETMLPFKDTFCPGVILDHIFVNDCVKVKCTAIDPAKVDGCYLSDHFPVIADVDFIAN